MMSQRSSSPFDNDHPVFWSSQQPAGVSRFFSQTHNPSQTLEDAFSRLSVSGTSFNYPHSDFVGDSPYGINGPSHPYNRWGGGIPTSQTSNLGHPTFTVNNYSYHGDEFLYYEPLTRQRENAAFNGVYPAVPFSNGMRPQETLNAGFFNGSGSDVLEIRIDERRLQWFSKFRSCVLMMATDQHMCRSLQETLRTLRREEFDIIFLELIDHMTDLIVDPFGNYVVQRMIELCSEEQQTQIVLRVTQYNFQLVRICLSPHGTRAVEKLLEHVTSKEQRDRVISALSPGAAILAKDVSGHRVILLCLKQFPREDNENLLNVVANKCFEIATDKTGCCVLQPCINHAQGEIKKKLIAAVMLYASLLAEDCYGNYVVQHLLSLGIPGVAESLWRQLEGRFFYLACNKYGSNVVEKFFQDSVEPQSTYITLELLHNPNVAMLLVDPYGNYVIKSALSASRGNARNALEQLIKQNSMMMQSNLFGKKLLAWFNKGRI